MKKNMRRYSVSYVIKNLKLKIKLIYYLSFVVLFNWKKIKKWWGINWHSVFKKHIGIPYKIENAHAF